MKYRGLTLLAAAALVFFLAACQNQAPVAPSLRVVDHEAVFRQSDAGQKSMTYLQGLNQKFMTELQDMQKGQEATTEEDQAKLQADMQASMNRYRTELTAEQERVVQVLNEAFTKAIEDYRQANNVSMVLPVGNVIAYDPAIDITEAMVAAMNQMNIDVEPAAEPEQAEGEAEQAEEPVSE